MAVSAALMQLDERLSATDPPFPIPAEEMLEIDRGEEIDYQDSKFIPMIIRTKGVRLTALTLFLGHRSCSSAGGRLGRDP